jgi:hypothetical protein
MSNIDAKGIGKRLTIYVPLKDMGVIRELEKISETRRGKGYQSSLSFELLRLARVGLSVDGVIKD